MFLLCICYHCCLIVPSKTWLMLNQSSPGFRLSFGNTVKVRISRCESNCPGFGLSFGNTVKVWVSWCESNCPGFRLSFEANYQAYYSECKSVFKPANYLSEALDEIIRYHLHSCSTWTCIYFEVCDQVSLFEWSFGWNNWISVYDKYSLNLCVYILLQKLSC